MRTGRQHLSHGLLREQQAYHVAYPGLFELDCEVLKVLTDFYQTRSGNPTICRLDTARYVLQARCE